MNTTFVLELLETSTAYQLMTIIAGASLDPEVSKLKSDLSKQEALIDQIETYSLPLGTKVHQLLFAVCVLLLLGLTASSSFNIYRKLRHKETLKDLRVSHRIETYQTQESEQGGLDIQLGLGSERDS